ncbi:MAG: hypothetical protein HYZ37_04835 [Candidatus Solibacter usitatus]|nr:hypothetical protein [Candidatus Solibacter usitatus]
MHLAPIAFTLTIASICAAGENPIEAAVAGRAASPQDVAKQILATGVGKGISDAGFKMPSGLAGFLPSSRRPQQRALPIADVPEVVKPKPAPRIHVAKAVTPKVVVPQGPYDSVSLSAIAPPPIDPTPALPVFLVASAEEMRQIAKGTERYQVLDRLGRPYTRISMPEENGFVEVYAYRNPEGPVGSVRLVNGRVTNVTLAAR